jgi:hypothetical protein
LIIINNAIKRANKLKIHIYQFLKLWILFKFKKNNYIPLITLDLLKQITTLLTLNNSSSYQGASPSKDNYDLFMDDKDKIFKYSTK